jgi:hypothetical protein
MNTLSEKIEAIEDYNTKAEIFLIETGAEIKTVFSRKDKHFTDDKEPRDIYNITIVRGRRSMSFSFGQSIINSEHWTAKDIFVTGDGNLTTKVRSTISRTPYRFQSKKEAIEADMRYNGSNFGMNVKHHPRQEPKAYDILACLTKYHPGTFEDFCGEFGCDTDSKKAEKLYYAVLKEYADLSSIFNADELEAMQEIS